VVTRGLQVPDGVAEAVTVLEGVFVELREDVLVAVVVTVWEGVSDTNALRLLVGGCV